MSKETLEELKAIIDNAPYENIGEDIFINTHGNYVLFYEDDFYTRDGDKWVKCCGFLPCYGLRSLSDIERIIELKEQVKAGYESYARIEAVKQRYNAENKQLTEALKGVMQIFAAVPDGFYRNELSKARVALGLGVHPNALADKDTNAKAKNSGDCVRS